MLDPESVDPEYREGVKAMNELCKPPETAWMISYQVYRGDTVLRRETITYVDQRLGPIMRGISDQIENGEELVVTCCVKVAAEELFDEEDNRMSK